MKKIGFISRVWSWVRMHRIRSIIIGIIILATIYGIYSWRSSASTTTYYTLAQAHEGTVAETVTGSGQVSAENQLDISSEVSGTIQSIAVTVGQKVNQGDLIAVIDHADAAADLETARISYAKLVEPASTGDIASAQNTLTKAYDDGFNSIASTFTNLPEIMSGLKSILYDQGSYLNDQDLISISQIARQYRTVAGTSYDLAQREYDSLLGQYRGISRLSSTSTIESMVTNTYTLMRDVSDAVKNSRTAITYIQTNLPDYKTNEGVTASTNVNSWSSSANSLLTSLLSAKNSIHTSKQSLQDLVDGADTLDIESQQISLSQKERAYAKYFIRAPFSGVIGKISATVYGKASSGTSIATIVGERKISTISLNEVDAAKVSVGQHVDITFDAIDGLNATGTVSRVDQVGTVSSGVVSYNVRMDINTEDARIRPGMSLNASIVVNESTGIVVPSSAVKTLNGSKYILTFNTTSDQSQGSTTRSRSTNAEQQVTMTSAVAPTQTPVTVGISNDTSTLITSGLNAGQRVVVKTTTGSATKTTTTPSILNSLTPQRNRTSSSSSSSSSKTTSSSNSAPSGPPPGM